METHASALSGQGGKVIEGFTHNSQDCIQTSSEPDKPWAGTGVQGLATTPCHGRSDLRTMSILCKD